MDLLTWLTYAEFHTFSLTSLSKLLKLDAWRLQRGAFEFAYVRAWAECRQFGPDLSLYKIVKSCNLVNSWRARLVHWRWWRLRHRTLTEANDQRGVGIRDIPYDTLQKQMSEFQNLTGPLTLPLPFLTILACLSTCLSFIYLYIYTHLPAKPRSWKLTVTGCGKSWFFTCSMLSASSQLQLVLQIISI